MDQRTSVRTITQLMHMEEAAREAYDAAMGKLPGSRVHSSMERFRHTHQQHAEGLQQVARSIGGEPVGSAAQQQYMDEVVDSVRQARDFHGLLSTIRVMEAALELQYSDAMDMGLPQEAEQTVRTYLRDEREMPDLLKLATHGMPEA